MNRVLEVLANPKILKKLLSMYKSGYLYEIGWMRSFLQMIPVDKEGNPLPWTTYGFIDFIDNRLHKEMNVFEYGSGNSTLWYAQKVKHVVSVEHDKEWFEKIKEKMPKNATIYYEALVYGGNYSLYLHKIDMKFDIVIIDGRDRVQCIKNSMDSLKEGGVIVLDDSEREMYQEGVAFLLDHGFKRVDFWGISPGLFYKKNTTIFYKQNNCLGI